MRATIKIMATTATAAAAARAAAAAKRDITRYYYNSPQFIDAIANMQAQTQKQVSAHWWRKMMKDWIVDLAFDDLDDTAKFENAQQDRAYGEQEIKRVFNQYNACMPMLIWTYPPPSPGSASSAEATTPIFAAVRRLVYRTASTSRGRMYNYLLPEIEYPIGSCCTFTIANLNTRLGLRGDATTTTTTTVDRNNGLSIWMYHPQNIVCSYKAAENSDLARVPEIPVQYFLDPLRLGPFIRFVGDGSAAANNTAAYVIDPFRTTQTSWIVQRLQEMFPTQPHPDLVTLRARCKSEQPNAVAVCNPPITTQADLEQYMRAQSSTQQREYAVTSMPVPADYIYSHAVYLTPLDSKDYVNQRFPLWRSAAQSIERCCATLNRPYVLRIETRGGAAADTTTPIQIFATAVPLDPVSGAQVVDAATALIPLVSDRAGNFTYNVDARIDARGAEFPCTAVAGADQTTRLIEYTLTSCPHAGTGPVVATTSRTLLTRQIKYYSPYTPALEQACASSQNAAYRTRQTQPTYRAVTF